VGKAVGGYGDAEITWKVFGYRKIIPFTKQVLEVVEFTLPPYEYISQGFWIDGRHERLHSAERGRLKRLTLRESPVTVPFSISKEAESKGFDVYGCIHAVNHAIIALLPLYVSATPGDVGTECRSALSHKPRPHRYDCHFQKMTFACIMSIRCLF
jgi:hypothetical protein